MLAFFKTPFATYASRDNLMLVVDCIKALAQRHLAGKVSIYVQKALLDSLRILQANIDCLGICRMNLKQVLNTEDFKTIS